MHCSSAKEMVFSVYELFSDGRAHDTNKTFSVSKQESDDILRKFGHYPDATAIDSAGIVLTLFHKVYNFTVGCNGFVIQWEIPYEIGYLYWRGPANPEATPCGGRCWKIVRKV
jgi:hypothetical protein